MVKMLEAVFYKLGEVVPEAGSVHHALQPNGCVFVRKVRPVNVASGSLRDAWQQINGAASQ